MKILNPKQWSKKTELFGVEVPKGVLYFLGSIFTLTLVLWVAGFAYRSGMYGPTFAQNMNGGASVGRPGMMVRGGGTTGGGYGVVAPTAPSYDYDMAEESMARDYAMGGGDAMMTQPYPIPNFASGRDAESFEVKEYQVNIKTSESDSACSAIAALKSRQDVIFEVSNTSEYGCDFRFKSTRASAENILSLLESFNPEYSNANTATIKATLEDIANTEEILKKKLESIDETLAQAEKAYDDIAESAAANSDSKTLAMIIQNKLSMIERMTNERIMINQALDSLRKQDASERDRLEYAFFTVTVYEDKIFDPKRIGDEWRAAAQHFISEFNSLLVGFSLGLVFHLFLALQLVLYLFLLLILLKYLWRYGKKFWES